MAIRLLSAYMAHSAGKIARDISYHIEQDLVDRGAASYDLTGGTETSVRTFDAGLSAEQIAMMHAFETNKRLNENGYGFYADTEFDQASPMALSANTENVVTINAAVKREQELPFGVSSLWDEVNSKILGINAGDLIGFTLNYTIRRTTGTGRWEHDVWIDIGTGARLFPHNVAVDNGGAWRQMSFSAVAFTGENWVPNGGLIKIDPETAAQVYGVSLIVAKLRHGQGDYS